MNTPDTLHATSGNGRITDKFRDLGVGMKDIANRGVGSVTDHAQAAQREVSRYANQAGRYVTDQPLKSALIAAGIGALVAGVILALRHQRDR